MNEKCIFISHLNEISFLFNQKNHHHHHLLFGERKCSTFFQLLLFTLTAAAGVMWVRDGHEKAYV